MADIELVIKIAEESYKEIKKIVADRNDHYFLENIIANGTPLSKGYGDLEDRPTGHWISSTIQGEIDGQIVKAFICSECGAISVFRITDGKIINGDLCPNCGAKMESEG